MRIINWINHQMDIAILETAMLAIRDLAVKCESEYDAAEILRQVERIASRALERINE